MTTKTKKKGKTIPLTDFLAAESKLVTIRPTNWSEIVDNEEAEVKPMVIDIGNLPTAPRSALDVDYSTVPNTSPFMAHITNLSFEVDDQGLRNIFADLTPKSARVIRDGMRSKGVGLVEFETRENLIEALKRTDKEFYGRRIHINVSDKTHSHTDGGRGGFGHNRSNRTGGEERPEMSDRWKRAEPRSDEISDDRPSGGFNRDNRQNRGDHGRSNMGGSRDNQHGNDFGFGYPRTRDDRGPGGSGGGGGSRDYNRQGSRNNRYPDDGNRPSSGTDRPRYAGRYSDTRDTRDGNRPSDEPQVDQREPPRERQRLQLQPRTKPVEENQPLSDTSPSMNNAVQSSVSNPDESSSSITNKINQQDSSRDEHPDENEHQELRSPNDNATDEQSTFKPSRGAGASIFGGAKPVDTTARELEIERKIKEQQLTSGETPVDTEDKGASTRPSYNRVGEREVYRAKRTSQNDDGRSGHGGDYHHKREYSGGRQYEDEGRRRSDDHARRGGGGGGGHDRERYGGPSRRDHDSGRTDNDRGTYRNRDDRTHESNEFNNPGRPSNNNFNSEAQPRTQQRGTATRRTIQTNDDSHRLQLSNKFVMLDVEDHDDNNENDDVQSPIIDE
ncbi:unnamed protein product [Rotaria magnacalcarata]|uniref:RRM domain-containing protein n=1 Tax=Rotaria magnacalcarata TaxID=392030 RepID=A0A817A3S2_9BILA|nr:unnamed protein product [Rotaria magnacalcarata]CAF2241394.1 unnamed protein product [Rotaria magnacalcarata]